MLPPCIFLTPLSTGIVHHYPMGKQETVMYHGIIYVQRFSDAPKESMKRQGYKNSIR